jgi:phenylacetate-CoA ligase
MPAWKSSIPGIVWPGLPSPQGAALLALQFQLEHSERLPLADFAAQQYRQLGAVLSHALRTVPWHRERLAAAGIAPDHAIDPQAFARIPVMTRRDIQDAGNALLSTAVPPDHGRPVEYLSGGSTGEPVRVYGTELNRLFWLALTQRDHLWHQRDLGGTLCVIRSRTDDRAAATWGPASDSTFETGPSAVLNINADIGRQLAWLQQHDPVCLLTHPTNLRELARTALAERIALPRLRECRTFGEVLPADLRALCANAWNARVTDSYSAEETGYIALQCPQHEHYHVQSENLLVELLDDNGAPCRPGETGRVVVTTLHNFAMPLIRYAIGDYAEAGAPCDCGRTLPVLARIHGRQRNMLVLPDGRRHWPSFPAIRYAGIAPLRQLQIVQRSAAALEARYVAERALTPEELRNMTAAIRRAMGHPFDVTFTAMESIPRSASMKFEDFISDITGGDVLA